MKRIMSFILPLVAIFILAMSSSAHAVVFYVNSTGDSVAAKIPDGDCNVGGVCTLREAIREANFTPDADEISFNGMIGSTITLKDTLTIKHPLILTGFGNADLTISGNKKTQIFVIESKVTISGLTLIEGYSSGNGGAIEVTATGKLILMDSIIEKNSAEKAGGAIYNDGIFLKIVNSSVNDNSAGGNGGAIQNNGYFSMESSALHHNTAQGDGGALFDASAVPPGINGIYNTTFYTNKSKTGSGGAISFNGSGKWEIASVKIEGAHEALLNGGAIAIHNGQVDFENLTVRSAYAGQNGGALYIFGGTTVVTVKRSLFFFNNAWKNGGAISLMNFGVLNAKNVTFSTNTAGDHGGALYSESSSSFNNVTATKNSANNGKGGAVHVAGPGSADMKNSILAGNKAITFPAAKNCFGSVTSSGHNLDDDLTCGFSDKTKGDLQGTDARLDSTLDGSTHSLLAGSPAIDAGDSKTCEKTDQRGIARPLGSQCDIGAFEATPVAVAAPPAPPAPGPGPVPPTGPGGSGSTSPTTGGSSTPVAAEAMMMMGGGCRMALGASAPSALPTFFAAIVFLGMIVLRKKNLE